MSKSPLKLNLDALTDKDLTVLQNFAAVEPPKNAELIPSSPLDIKRYNQTLVAPDIPTFEDTIDHTTGVTGFGGSGPAQYRELLSELTEGDQVRLLHANNIRPVVGADGKPAWEMKAFVVGADLESPTKGAVRFRSLEMLNPGLGSIDHVAYSYKSFESNIQRQTVAKSELEFGIPGIFKVSSSYGEVSATATKEKEVNIFSEASHLIPKAKIVINDKHVTLDPEFISELEGLTGATGTKEQKANQLLDLLTEYGQFVAVSLLLGGRLTFHTVTKLNDKVHYKKVKREFKAAADARFSVEGVPVELGGGVGVGDEDTGTTQSVIQSKSLHMELRGGDENLASMKPNELGRATAEWKPGQNAATWVGSLGRYREWRIVGFYDRSMVPILDFLPKEKQKLRDTCMDLLRDYFVAKLSISHSDTAGHYHGKDLFKDSGSPPSHTVKRISAIDLRHGGALDALRLHFEVYTGVGKETKTVTSKWIGSTDAGKEVNIVLKKGEELTAIETWTDPTREGGLLQQVAFVMNTKRRYPGDTGFYGENRGRKKDEFKTIHVPRVRGIDGANGAYVHRIGLAYAALDGNAKSREFLLAMEPFLFPDADYGMVSP
jgi:MAC/Perforin domain